MSKRLPLVRFKMGRTSSCNNLLVLNCKVFDTLAPNVLPGFDDGSIQERFPIQNCSSLKLKKTKPQKQGNKREREKTMQ